MALWVIPSVSLIMLRVAVDDSLSELDPDRLPVLVQPSARSDDSESAATAKLTWRPPVEVPAPHWSGTVTGVYVEPGARVKEGHTVVSIDSISRVAVATASPFVRRLARRSTGEDVEELQRLLQAWGWYDDSIDGSYGPGTASAVSQWAKSLGIDKPDGSFDPAWTVWLPHNDFEVDLVGVRVGFPAPQVGSAVISSPQVLTSANLASADGGRELRLTEDWVLFVRETQINIESGQLGPRALVELAAVTLPEDQEVAGLIRRAVPLDTLDIPVSAVMVGREGVNCVWVASGVDSYLPREVSLGEGRTGLVVVTAGLSIEDQLLVNPAEILEDPSCP